MNIKISFSAVSKNGRLVIEVSRGIPVPVSIYAATPILKEVESGLYGTQIEVKIAGRITFSGALDPDRTVFFRPPLSIGPGKPRIVLTISPLEDGLYFSGDIELHLTENVADQGADVTPPNLHRC
ncbi:hypothetical protein [Shinella zoogloeoides]|uniref:hypothetical protein n=1 Tax=Shinella zoogloeoides TaxID=352475 RepID=UPI00273E8688|nr:hypothetical protein [Shinella zoogloeoides]WLR92193.1 hypothetical protein Q9316_17255 [Shinella zoogloeoides]